MTYKKKRKSLFDKWDIINKIPIGIIGAILVQSLTAVWWIAQLDSRVIEHEEWIEHNINLPDHVSRLDERVFSLHEDMNELEVRMNNVR